MIDLIVNAGAMREDDYIDKTLGQLRCLYYMYLDTLHVRPKDLIDMVDGILYIDCKNYVQQMALDRASRKAEMERQGKK